MLALWAVLLGPKDREIKPSHCLPPQLTARLSPKADDRQLTTDVLGNTAKIRTAQWSPVQTVTSQSCELQKWLLIKQLCFGVFAKQKNITNVLLFFLYLDLY